MPDVKRVKPITRIGHKGADFIAPGNTPASFDAALAAGVHMIEFDVLPENLDDPEGSALRLAHDYTHDVAGSPTLEEGLDHLASKAFADIELDVDLKAPGYEKRRRPRAARPGPDRAHARLDPVHAQPDRAARARADAAARLVGPARAQGLHEQPG